MMEGGGFVAVGGVEGKKSPPRASRFVGLFDVLGFSHISETSSLDELEERYSPLLKETYDATNRAVAKFGEGRRYVEVHRVPKVVFSDTILVWQRSEGIDDAYYFFKAVCRLMSSSIFLGMPLRGGIAFGECLMEEGLQQEGLSGGKVLGKPVVNAYRVEQSLQWAGVALHVTAAEEIKRLKFEKDTLEEVLVQDKFLCHYQPPLKMDKMGMGVSDYVLDWTAFQDDRYGDTLAHLLSEAESDDAKLKLANTLAFLVRQSGKEPPKPSTP